MNFEGLVLSIIIPLLDGSLYTFINFFILFLNEPVVSLFITSKLYSSRIIELKVDFPEPCGPTIMTNFFLSLSISNSFFNSEGILQIFTIFLGLSNMPSFQTSNPYKSFFKLFLFVQAMSFTQSNVSLNTSSGNLKLIPILFAKYKSDILKSFFRPAASPQ